MCQHNGVICLGERPKSGIALFDGAMGTELLRRTNEALPCAQVNLTKPNLVHEIHREYLNAGADIIRTNSFGANRNNLKPFGLDNQVGEINRAAVEIARDAIKVASPVRQVLVAGSIGPIRLSRGDESISVEEICVVYREQAEALVEAGVEMLFGETFQRIEDVAHLLNAILPVADSARPRVAVGVSISPPESSGRAADLAAEFYALISTGFDVSFVGCNCGYGPTSMIAPITIMRQKTTLPLAVLPSAGLPITEGMTVRYPCEPDEFAASLMNLTEQQLVQAVGGCCGTTPEYIAALARMRAAIRSN